MSAWQTSKTRRFSARVKRGFAGEAEADGVGLDDLGAARLGESAGQIGLAVAGEAGEHHEHGSCRRTRGTRQRGTSEREVGFGDGAGGRRHGARRAR